MAGRPAPERFDRAIEQLQRLLSIDPDHGVAAANLEEAFKRKQKFDVAKRERKMRARQIVLATREEAEAVRAQISNGDDFIRMAREKSIDSSSAKGGDIGFFSKGELDNQEEEAILALSQGEISGSVTAGRPAHPVIRRTAARKAAPRMLCRAALVCVGEVPLADIHALLKEHGQIIPGQV